MEITQKTVLRHFLGTLEKQMEAMKVSEISPFFKDYFTHEELIDIIQWMYDPKDLKHIKLGGMQKAELEDMVGSDADILGYFLYLWDMETAAKESLDPGSVDNTLVSMQRENHYLANKPVRDWDGYDRANYLSMRLQSGRLQKVYGIYDIMVTQKEVDRVDSPPKRFYGTQELAGSALQDMIENKEFEDGDLRILHTYKAT